MCLSQDSENSRDVGILALWQALLLQTSSDLKEEQEFKIYPKA